MAEGLGVARFEEEVERGSGLEEVLAQLARPQFERLDLPGLLVLHGRVAVLNLFHHVQDLLLHALAQLLHLFLVLPPPPLPLTALSLIAALLLLSLLRQVLFPQVRGLG